MLESTNTRIGPNQRNTLGLDGPQYARLLARLDEVGAASGCDNTARIYRRLNYVFPRVLLSVESNGHSRKDMVVATRNISQGGVSILHSSFMYPSTPVSIYLPDHTGHPRLHMGKVTRCEHRGGVLHEIGIVFNNEIRLREYLPPDSHTLVHSHENVNAESLESNILFVSDDADFGSLVRQFLMVTKIKFAFEKDAQSATENADQYAMIAVHHDQATRQAPTTVALLRDAGFRGPIILLGVPESEAETHIMHACGADMVVPWPCEGKTFICGLAEYILNQWTHESLATIRACVGPDIKAALRDELAYLGIRLDQAARTKDHKLTRSTLLLIKQIALIQDLKPLANTITDLTRCLDSDTPFDDLGGTLTEIAGLCQHANNQAA